MLETIPAAPRDAILGLTAAFREDPRSEKINLSVGVYQDETGKTPTLECVRIAEQRLVESAAGKSYLPIPGAPEYAEVVQELAFGATHEVVTSGRIASAHTPGGTGALRVAGDFLKSNLPSATIWMSEPTWPNHGNIFAAAGVPAKSYAYFDQESNGLAIGPMLEAIKQMPAGDVILLHGCCHNPTGIDPTPEQWKQIAEAVRDRGLLPLLDFAYQGFAEGIDEDAVGLRAFSQPGSEMIVCSSFSKNFGLYRERVGSLSIVCPNADVASAIQSQINSAIRANYSNPPAHGAAIVNCVLRDEALRKTWEKEVATMRSRINDTRKQFVDALTAKGVPGDYSFITRQRGMFSFSGLTKEQVEVLREKYAIYIVGSGRINVAGLTPANIDRVAEAIAVVVGPAA
ncbi:MAG: aspartate/tyrosine/aromatic aminotransferase [Planctomycetales bacterium]|nr:aspartate/tyrosine/aromatic aminotransferase [Planctomycetales bacterium]